MSASMVVQKAREKPRQVEDATCRRALIAGGSSPSREERIEVRELLELATEERMGRVNASDVAVFEREELLELLQERLRLELRLVGISSESAIRRRLRSMSFSTISSSVRSCGRAHAPSLSWRFSRGCGFPALGLGLRIMPAAW